MTKGSSVTPLSDGMGIVLDDRIHSVAATNASMDKGSPSTLPPIEPLLVSERFNGVSRDHLEQIAPAMRRKEHFNLVMKSDMRCETPQERHFTLGPSGKWTIDPRGKQWVAYFDQAIAISLIYTAFVTPYEIGFLNGMKQEIDALFIIGNLINLVFMVDFILNFFLQYQRNSDGGGSYEGNHRAIIRHYLKTHCLVDFASSIPWDAVELLTGGGTQLSAMRLLRLLRLLKLLRIVRGSRLIEKYKAEFQFSFANVTLGLYVVTIILFAHWVACLWGYAATSREGGNTWMVAEDIDDADPFTQYTVALYFATMTITTVGYGDVTPQNRDEYILVTVVMIAGGFLWAYVIGGICSLVATMNFDKRRFQQDFDRVNGMLDDLEMPSAFCTYVRRYMFNAEPMLRRNTYGELIDLLTPHQQREIAVHRSRANLVQVPYLRDCSPESVLKIYSALRQMVYAPQEMLDLPHTLYIVVNSGIVVKGGQVFSLGSCLAVDFILESEKLVDHSIGTALTFVQVETLHRDTLFKVLEAFPVDYHIVRRAKIRLSLMRKVLELANLEVQRKTGAKRMNAFKRWSLDSKNRKFGLVRSLSTVPVLSKRVSDSDIMYAKAPRSLSINNMDQAEVTEYKKNKTAIMPEAHFKGRVQEIELKPDPRKTFVDALSTQRQKKRETLKKPPPSIRHHRSLSLNVENIQSFHAPPQVLVPNRSLDSSNSLSDLKEAVKSMESRTNNIENTMVQVTRALASLTSAINRNKRNSVAAAEDTSIAANILPDSSQGGTNITQSTTQDSNLTVENSRGESRELPALTTIYSFRNPPPRSTSLNLDVTSFDES